MTREIGEIFEVDGVKLRVEERIDGCKSCYFDNDSNFCVADTNITGKDNGRIFVEVEESVE